MVCKPSASAWSLTIPEPGTTIAYTELATFLPLATAATALISSILPFVHDPTNTLSTATSFIFVPGVKPMYSNDLRIAFALDSSKSSGFGTMPEMPTVSCGDVPHVTVGSISFASITTTLSNLASASVDNVFQYAIAFSQVSPLGAIGLFFKYS